MTLASLGCSSFPDVKDEAVAEEGVALAQAASEICVINQFQLFINMTQKSSVAPGAIRPEIVRRLWQKVLPLRCCISSHSHHPLLHLFTPLATAGTYAKSHPCKFGEKLNHSGVVCVYVCAHVWENLGLAFFQHDAYPLSLTKLKTGAGSECPAWCDSQLIVIITTTRIQLTQMSDLLLP